MNKKTEEKVRIKKSTTFSEQVNILESRNLKIEDRDEAIDILSRVNYYRLSAYMLSYKRSNEFQEDVSIRDIYSIYEFDKRFRNLVIGLLESIEIAFRTQIAYTIAHKYGPIGYLDKENFVDEGIHGETINQLLSEIDRSDEIFVRHHKQNYQGVFPVWVAIEVASFGLLSKIYSNLENEDKSRIAKEYYGLPYKYIKSWLYTLSTFRNKRAHYGRTYNKRLTIKPIIHKKDSKKGIENDTVFSVLFIMKKLVKDKAEWDTFVTNLNALVEKYEKVDVTLMGFPENWEDILRNDK